MNPPQGLNNRSTPAKPPLSPAFTIISLFFLSHLFLLPSCLPPFLLHFSFPCQSPVLFVNHSVIPTDSSLALAFLLASHTSHTCLVVDSSRLQTICPSTTLPAPNQPTNPYETDYIQTTGLSGFPRALVFPSWLPSRYLSNLPSFLSRRSCELNQQELSLSRPLPHSNTQRHHSHSISLGAVNPNHRISRRKSVTTTAAATNAVAAAVAASVKDPASGEPAAGAAAAASPIPANRRGSGRKPPLESSSLGTPSYLSQSMNNPVPQDPSSVAGNFSTAPPSAPDGTNPSTITPTTDPHGMKNRNRRASEGSPLVKGEGKRSMAELRCDRCGKGYKHGSCLSKHMCVSSPLLPRLARYGAIAPCWLCLSPSWFALYACIQATCTHTYIDSLALYPSG